MFNDMIRAHDLSIWPVTGLMIFFVFMTGVFVWTLWPSRKAAFEALRFAALDGAPAHPGAKPQDTAGKEPQ